MRGLYAIIDTSSLTSRGLEPIRFAEAVLSARPSAIQLRDKRGSARDTLALLRELAPMCQRSHVALICNDRPDLALLAGCDGVHLGQRDLPPRQARALTRRCGAELSIGMSAHNLAELAVAESQPLDYVAFGPVFGTRSKTAPEPTLGVDGLAQLVAELRRRDASLPVVAIGGIDATNAARVHPHCDAVASIGALLPDQGAPAPYEQAAARTGELRRLLEGAA